MQALFYTFTFLSLLAMLSTARWSQWQNTLWISQEMKTHYEHHHTLSMAMQFHHFQTVSVKKAPTQKDPPNPKKEHKVPSNSLKRVLKPRILDNARLNLGAALFVDASKLYPVAEKLLNELYGQIPFYQEAKENYPDLETRLLTQIKTSLAPLVLETKTSTPIKYSSDLLALAKMESPELQKVYYKLLKGSEAEGENYPSLLRFVTFLDWRKQGDLRKINYTYAANPLRVALFNQEIVDQIEVEKQKILNPSAPASEKTEENELTGEVFVKNVEMIAIITRVLADHRLAWADFMPIVECKIAPTSPIQESLVDIQANCQANNGKGLWITLLN